MHESYDFYQLCQRTSRNLGLYTADQVVNRRDQRGTRQNPNGNRNGIYKAYTLHAFIYLYILFTIMCMYIYDRP